MPSTSSALLATTTTSVAALLFAVVLFGTAVTPSHAQGLPQCFLSMGDWGYDNINVASMSKHMQNVIKNPHEYGCANISLTLALGDNFYNSGVSSVDDPEWDSIFVQQFRKYPAFKNMPVYSMLGDHDYAAQAPTLPPNFTRAHAQVEYYYKKDRLWVMPDTNYSFFMDIGSGKRLKFVVINSQALYACLHTNFCFQKNHEAWIEEEVAEADNDDSISAVVILGHHAVVCPLGGHYDPKLDAILVPIARRHRVSLVMTGHSHFIAWSQESTLTADGGSYGAGDLWYIVNGAGRGAGAYPCWWHGLNMPIAKPKNKVCMPAEINQQGAFMLHRVHHNRFDHCVLDSMNGTLVRCINSAKFREVGDAPPAPATPIPNPNPNPVPPSPPSPPAGGCGKCTSAECANQRCPAVDPYFCSAGPAQKGCSPTSWAGSPACSRCCDVTTCA